MKWMPIIIQGNSLWRRYELTRWAEIADTWTADFVGQFKIINRATGALAHQGSLLRDTDGVFLLKLGSDDSTWSALPVAIYNLIVQFSNQTVGYVEEQLPERITIKSQGI